MNNNGLSAEPWCRPTFTSKLSVDPINTEMMIIIHIGAIQVLRNADGVGGCMIFWKKRYEGVMFNVISGTRCSIRTFAVIVTLLDSTVYSYS